MPASKTSPSLTPEVIAQLLDQHTQTNLSADYMRLMEIYCVVKAGGVRAQVSAARHQEATERAAVQIAIAELSEQPDQESRIESLRQEIAEIERFAGHRIAYLNAIDPQEAASVHNCLALIDAYFANLRKAQTL
ncbi:MAG: hypothetical protein ACFB0E_20950 [Leptolyngbyaceae cyanobacterium]